MRTMPSFALFIEMLLTAWLTLVDAEGIRENFNNKKQARQAHLSQPRHQKRVLAPSNQCFIPASSPPPSSAASSVPHSSSIFSYSSSSSSYVVSFPASSTFTISTPASVYVPEPTPASCGSEDCEFYSPQTELYFIAEWPDVDWDAGEFYGGNTPVSIFGTYAS